MNQNFIVKNKHPQHPAYNENYGYHIQQNSHNYNIILTSNTKLMPKTSCKSFDEIITKS